MFRKINVLLSFKLLFQNTQKNPTFKITHNLWQFICHEYTLYTVYLLIDLYLVYLGNTQLPEVFEGLQGLGGHMLPPL